MATETVLSDHSTAPKQEVDKELQSEFNKMVPEKPEESSSPTATAAEAEPKIEEKQIEPPVTEEVKEISSDENPRNEDSALAESTEQKIEDKPIELPSSEEEKKTEDAPILEASHKSTPEVSKETLPEPGTSVLEPIVANSESKSEAELAEQLEYSKVESIEEKPEEPAEIVDVPESSAAQVFQEKVEKAQDLHGVKYVAVSETECKGDETLESTPVVEQKQSEQSELTENFEKESPAVEPIHTVVVETPTNMAKDIELPKEDKVAKEETSAIECSEKVQSHTPKTQVQENEVSEKTGQSNEEKESAKETVEGEEKTEILEAKTEEKSAVAEDLVQSEEKPIQDVSNSIPPPEVAEKAAEENVTSRDIELVADDGNKKDETVASAETPSDPQVKEKVDKEITEEKIKESVQTTEAKLEEEKQIDESAKTDNQNSESTKNSDDINAPKEEVPEKTQKQSNNIIKKVKQSLVKAKKAIIGKSQNSKGPASEPKDATNK